MGVVVKRWEVEVGVVDGCEACEGFEVVEAGAADFGRGEGAPVAPEREGAAGFAELRGEVGRFCVAGHHHAAAVFVDGGGREDGGDIFAEGLLEEVESG